MSDDVSCDKCGKAGRRRRMFPAPDDWLFLEAKDDESGEIVFVHACSMACAAGLWQCGPGPRFDAEEVLALPDGADPGPDFSAPIRLNPEDHESRSDNEPRRSVGPPCRGGHDSQLALDGVLLEQARHAVVEMVSPWGTVSQVCKTDDPATSWRTEYAHDCPIDTQGEPK